MNVPTNFNWRDYLINNIDLQQSRIRTKGGAEQHYKRHGHREDKVVMNHILVKIMYYPMIIHLLF